MQDPNMMEVIPILQGFSKMMGNMMVDLQNLTIIIMITITIIRNEAADGYAFEI